MIILKGNAPPEPPRPDEENHPALDDDILSPEVADTPIERTADEHRADEHKPTPPPPPDKARG
jgi:hypothetical protein